MFLQGIVAKAMLIDKKRFYRGSEKQPPIACMTPSAFLVKTGIHGSWIPDRLGFDKAKSDVTVSISVLDAT